MELWRKNRGNAFEQAFLDKLSALDIEVQQFDELCPYLDEVLCGATDEKLEALFPLVEGDLRLLLTRPYRSLPALRIAFSVDHHDGGKIVYRDVDVREDDDI